MYKDQKGSILILSIIGILIIAVLILTGAFLLRKTKTQNQRNSNPPSTVNSSPVSTASPKPGQSYENSDTGLKLQYPLDWKLVQLSEDEINLYPPTSDPNIPSTALSLTLTGIPYESVQPPGDDMTPFKDYSFDGNNGRRSDYTPDIIDGKRLAISGECQDPFIVELPFNNQTLSAFSCKTIEADTLHILDSINRN